MSRSTWACELKYREKMWAKIPDKSRSTWACELKLFCTAIIAILITSRSTWACELKWSMTKAQSKLKMVTLHVSVWVEIVSLMLISKTLMVSRSTWACELKFLLYGFLDLNFCHAPRERVSWNDLFPFQTGHYACHAPRERVSWNFFLFKIHQKINKSRSTWACELKFHDYTCKMLDKVRHAPRERVSWNLVPIFLHGTCVIRHAPRERVSWNW